MHRIKKSESPRLAIATVLSICLGLGALTGSVAQADEPSRPSLLGRVARTNFTLPPSGQTLQNQFVFGITPSSTSIRGMGSAPLQSLVTRMGSLTQTLQEYLSPPVLPAASFLNAARQTGVAEPAAPADSSTPGVGQSTVTPTQVVAENKVPKRVDLSGFMAGGVFNIDPSLAPVSVFAGGAR